MELRIIALVVFSILMIPLTRSQVNIDRERERKTLLVLLGLVGALMLFIGFLRRLT